MPASFVKRLLFRIFCHGEDPAEVRENRQKRAWAKERKQILKWRPNPLPETRLNLSQDFLVSPSTVPPTCALLSLPFELRQSIYENALGESILLLSNNYGKIRIHRTLPPHCVTWSSDGPKYKWNMETADFESRSGFPTYRLLLTCRQIYVEAIDILYSKNVFNLDSPLMLIHLKDLSFLPQRFHKIRHLSLSWTYMTDPAHFNGSIHEPYDWATWERFWKIIAHDMRLVSLSANIGYIGDRHGLNMEGDWMKPILEVRGLREAKICVRWLNTVFTSEQQPELASSLTQSLMRQHETPTKFQQSILQPDDDPVMPSQ
ncbi:MAG: hypothetical protein Q9194_004895 [Teloschistes cf. exilis]